MHELSIAQAVVGIAARHAGAGRVIRVELRVGHLRQVVPDALEFAFGLVAEGTPVEGAELAIERVPVRVACAACGGEGEVGELPFLCPACGGADVSVVAGEELEVDSLELEEEPILQRNE